MRRVAGIALLLALAVFGTATVAACGSKDITTPAGTIDKAKDVAAQTQVMVVKTGIANYIATNSALPPAASQEVLGGLVNPWPKNPWTQAPMAPGEQPGDIVYTPGTGLSYSLGVHLGDGSVYTTP